jgi:3-oxoacyl-[acyl-carrier protein] reductase
MTVSPAAVDTGLVPGRTTSMVENVAATTPLKRVAQADEVALAVMTAVTQLTASIGVLIPVDGSKLVGRAGTRVWGIRTTSALPMP